MKTLNQVEMLVSEWIDENCSVPARICNNMGYNKFNNAIYVFKIYLYPQESLRSLKIEINPSEDISEQISKQMETYASSFINQHEDF